MRSSLPSIPSTLRLLQVAAVEWVDDNPVIDLDVMGQVAPPPFPSPQTPSTLSAQTLNPYPAPT